MAKSAHVAVAAALGVAAGILFAPKSGKATREDIKARAKDAKHVASEKADQIKGAVKEGADTFKHGAKELGEQAKDLGKSVKESAKKVGDEAKDLGDEAKIRANHAADTAKRTARRIEDDAQANIR